jgi:dihydroflavonol-4-reductase
MIPHDLHHFVGQHVFVTGASGFIGGHVASLLIRAGAHVRALTRSTKEGYDSAIDWVEGDLLARDSIDAAMKDCRYVFHVAGDYRFWARNPREIFANNVQHSLFFVHRCIPVVGASDVVSTIGSPANETP